MKRESYIKKTLSLGLAVVSWLMAGISLATAAPVLNQSALNMAPVTIPSCVVSSAPPQVDFGRQSRGQLKAVPGGMSPGSRMMAVSLACNVSQPLKLRISGTAAGSHFLFGDDGQLKITAVKAQLDGKPVPLQRNKDGAPGNGISAFPFELLPEDVMVPVVNGQPANGVHLTVVLQLDPVLGPKASRPTQQTEKQSQLSFSREP